MVDHFTRLYDAVLSKFGIDLIKPGNEQIEVCDSVIRSVTAGDREVAMRSEHTDVLGSVYDQGCDAIILGCTELPLVMDYEVLGKRVVSSDVILAHGMAEFCYSE